jgi:hypothetical protein
MDDTFRNWVSRAARADLIRYRDQLSAESAANEDMSPELIARFACIADALAESSYDSDKMPAQHAELFASIEDVFHSVTGVDGLISPTLEAAREGGLSGPHEKQFEILRLRLSGSGKDEVEHSLLNTWRMQKNLGNDWIIEARGELIESRLYQLMGPSAKDRIAALRTLI